MGRKYKFIPAETLDQILSLRKQGKSFLHIADAVGVNPQRISQICCSSGLDKKREYKNRTVSKKRKTEGFIVTGNVTHPSTKKRLRKLYSPNSIITDYLLNDKVINTFTRTFFRPLTKH